MPVLKAVQCRISVTFIDRDGSEYKVQASVGEDMLSVAHREDIDLEGACEGSLACSTCHVIVNDQEYFDKIPEADDDENDMLDLAFGLTQTCDFTFTLMLAWHVVKCIVCPTRVPSVQNLTHL